MYVWKWNPSDQMYGTVCVSLATSWKILELELKDSLSQPTNNIEMYTNLSSNLRFRLSVSDRVTKYIYIYTIKYIFHR